MAVIWSEAAVQDLQDIFDYVAEDSPQNALLVDSRICEQTDELVRFPALGRPGQFEGTRELIIQRTPYIAIYRVEEDDTLRVVRILHAAQEWPSVM